ncbi:hypothetical protein CYMTET_28522 [Cymbomonas tetramitiformis]|uniref:Mutator-like transposase domain-containing protein n=1 Tax=Cymbomonas tetramitiformis TaxID=36881 RepID=A0AAE0FMM2_9CHLO|nr:hypothetical protein CYMTET_28522 [Cymbomonas tetramitiformis]
MNGPSVPAVLKPVEKLSDPNHLKKLLYGDLLKLRNEHKWSGSVLSVAIIKCFQYQYITVLEFVATAPGMTEPEKIVFMVGAVTNIVDHAFGCHGKCGDFIGTDVNGVREHWCKVAGGDAAHTPSLPGGKYLRKNAKEGYYAGIKKVYAKYSDQETNPFVSH